MTTQDLRNETKRAFVIAGVLVLFLPAAGLWWRDLLEKRPPEKTGRDSQLKAINTNEDLIGDILVSGGHRLRDIASVPCLCRLRRPVACALRVRRGTVKGRCLVDARQYTEYIEDVRRLERCDLDATGKLLPGVVDAAGEGAGPSTEGRAWSPSTRSSWRSCTRRRGTAGLAILGRHFGPRVLSVAVWSCR